jgi:hypothetical protein
MPERRVYATREDWLDVFATLEAETPLKYVALGVYSTSEVPVFKSGAVIPELGEVADGEKVAGASFMVISANARYRAERVPQNAGGVLYFAEATNTKSIILQPGGRFKKRYLIEGEIVQAYNTPEAMELYRRFTAAMRGKFKRVCGAYVGLHALALQKEGIILTHSIKSPGKPPLPKPDE